MTVLDHNTFAVLGAPSWALKNIRDPAVTTIRIAGYPRRNPIRFQVLWDSIKMNISVSIAAIEKIGESAVEPLIDSLKDNDLIVQAGAAIVRKNKSTAITLGLIRDISAVDPLIQAFKDEKDETVKFVIEKTFKVLKNT